MEGEDLTTKQNNDVQQTNPSDSLTSQAPNITESQRPVATISQPQASINQVYDQQKPRSTTSKGFWIVLIIILILIIAGGWFVYQRYFKPDAIVSLTTTNSNNAATSSTDNWSNYNNATYNYSIKYPSDFTYTEVTDKINLNVGSVLFNSGNNKMIKKDTNLMLWNHDGKYKTLEEFLTKTQTDFTKLFKLLQIVPTEDDSKELATIVDGKDAKEFNYKNLCPKNQEEVSSTINAKPCAIYSTIWPKDNLFINFKMVTYSDSNQAGDYTVYKNMLASYKSVSS